MVRPASEQPEEPAQPVAQAPGDAAQAFRALRHRDFALFWSAALVSNSGSWMQNVTVPFVLYQTTGSATWVGFGSFAQYLPAFLLGPVGGVLADRFPRKRVTLAANLVGMTGATGLAVAWRDGSASPWTTVALVALVGVVAGIGIPAWQSLMPSLVPRELLQNAVTLNSAQFNASRAIGPALGGLVLAHWGPSAAFTINAFSYVAVWLAILATRAAEPRLRVHADGPLAQFRGGVVYARGHRGILLAVTLVLAVAFLGNPVMPFISVFARDEFQVGRTAYGVLYSAFGVGAVVSAVVLAARGDRIARSRQASVAMAAFAAILVVFALAPWYALGLVAMCGIGVAYLATVNAFNTSVQLLVEEEYRGRALSLYAMAVTGGYPLGALLQGSVASVVGVRATVAGAGLLLLAIALVVRRRPGFGSLDDHARRGVVEESDLV